MTVAVRVIPCLDVDGGRVVKGVNFRQLRDAGDPVELAAFYDGEGADELKDGTLRGPNLDLLRGVCGRTTAPVVASGGVSSLADLRAIAALVPLGVEGAIVGTALYEGAFTLEAALAAVSEPP